MSLIRDKKKYKLTIKVEKFGASELQKIRERRSAVPTVLC